MVVKILGIAWGENIMGLGLNKLVYLLALYGGGPILRVAGLVEQIDIICYKSFVLTKDRGDGIGLANVIYGKAYHALCHRAGDCCTFFAYALPVNALLPFDLNGVIFVCENIGGGGQRLTLAVDLVAGVHDLYGVEAVGGGVAVSITVIRFLFGIGQIVHVAVNASRKQRTVQHAVMLPYHSVAIDGLVFGSRMGKEPGAWCHIFSFKAIGAVYFCQLLSGQTISVFCSAVENACNIFSGHFPAAKGHPGAVNGNIEGDHTRSVICVSTGVQGIWDESRDSRFGKTGRVKGILGDKGILPGILRNALGVGIFPAQEAIALRGLRLRQGSQGRALIILHGLGLFFAVDKGGGNDFRFFLVRIIRSFRLLGDGDDILNMQLQGGGDYIRLEGILAGFQGADAQLALLGGEVNKLGGYFLQSDHRIRPKVDELFLTGSKLKQALFIFRLLGLAGLGSVGVGLLGLAGLGAAGVRLLGLAGLGAAGVRLLGLAGGRGLGSGVLGLAGRRGLGSGVLGLAGG